MNFFIQRYRARAIALLSYILLTACAMGPDYKRPSIEVNSQFRMNQDIGESVASQSWWEFLKDETLQQLITEAIINNQDLKRAVAMVEEYQARVHIARMDFLPKIDVESNAPFFGKLGGFPRPGFPTPFNYYGNAIMSWEIDVWGRIRRSTEAANADVFAQEENRRAILIMLISAVAQAYFDLLQYDTQRSIALQALASWEESVAISRAQLKAGLIPRIDLDQFEAERANAAALVADFERLIIQTENELNVLLGKKPSPILRFRTLAQQHIPPEIPAGLPSELLQRRPDIVQAEQVLAAATARIGMTKAMRFPRFSITGLLGVASPSLSNLLTFSDTKYGAGGIGLAAPLFNATILGFEQRAAEAQANQAIANYRQTILVAFKEVEDALIAIRKASEQRKARQQQVEALQSALHVANLRYRGGITSYVDVLLAKRNLYQAKFSHTEAHRLHLISIVRLYKALGGGWEREYQYKDTEEG
ncbi:efflux transporter outer membrane subunit [Nitrosomonas sp.]|uniref:efflux transporter outer membrane subunit n=1 Tax=Nitrosomonas sp. TaxID=42353 RepID=UPI001DB54D7F|nr:efflux transporter outer membrane subunit [Nitrosomonas sp.]MCB1948722.1 efflux transporter outer membrane subunit [Nitrosomonas sp.]MCP5243693.1 efflux transporter outer membrane subunit [Burkholderiales bacterium]MDR4515530.1 efflux transporter outer membrane subunit [Nitrosomonas sp.]